EKAVAYLKAHQAKDGSFSAQSTGPGVTALVAAALLRNGYTADDPLVAGTLAYLEKSIQSDGGIYEKRLANYTTSVALMALHQANKGGKYTKIIKNASDFLKGIQLSNADPKDPKAGGVGYGKEQAKPDASNTEFFVEAMLAAGVSRDDPAIQNAL